MTPALALANKDKGTEVIVVESVQNIALPVGCQIERLWDRVEDSRLLIADLEARADSVHQRLSQGCSKRFVLTIDQIAHQHCFISQILRENLAMECLFWKRKSQRHQR